jgi:hypothetical protein
VNVNIASTSTEVVVGVFAIPISKKLSFSPESSSCDPFVCRLRFAAGRDLRRILASDNDDEYESSLESELDDSLLVPEEYEDDTSELHELIPESISAFFSDFRTMFSFVGGSEVSLAGLNFEDGSEGGCNALSLFGLKKLNKLLCFFAFTVFSPVVIGKKF